MRTLCTLSNLVHPKLALPIQAKNAHIRYADFLSQENGTIIINNVLVILFLFFNLRLKTNASNLLILRPGGSVKLKKTTIQQQKAL